MGGHLPGRVAILLSFLLSGAFGVATAADAPVVKPAFFPAGVFDIEKKDDSLKHILRLSGLDIKKEDVY